MTTPHTPRDAQVLDLSAVELEPEATPHSDEEPFEASLAGKPKSTGLRWLALLGSGLLGLLVLGITLWAEALVRDLLVKQPALGWVALGFAGIALAGLVGFLAREIAAVMRLSALDDLRADVQAAYDGDDAPKARKALARLIGLYKGQASTARGRAEFDRQKVGVLDAQDLIIIAEETVLHPLDAEAVRLVSSAARRVSLVTALSPRALIDIVMVAVQCLSLTRQVAQLYGARPGFFGGLKLLRHMLTHLAITGGMAATEGLVSQVLGHSLAARLSARLGEGVINGLLTARVGIAAIAVTRPMPFLADTGPTLGEVTRGMASLGGTATADDETADKKKN